MDEGVKKDWKEAGVVVRPYGVKEVGEWVKGYVAKKAQSAVLEKGKEGDVRVLGAPECSWALSRACEPVSLRSVPSITERDKLMPSLSSPSSAALSSHYKPSKIPLNKQECALRISGMVERTSAG